MMFAGMMRYRMSNETYTQLVQLGESRSGQANDWLLTVLFALQMPSSKRWPPEGEVQVIWL